MPTIMKSSFIRALFIAAFASVCLFNQAKTASAQSHKYRVLLEAANGELFAGESICVDKRSACKNEKVVYVLEQTGRDTREILVTSDLLRGGVRVPIFRAKVHYDQSIKYFTGRFLTARDLANDSNEVTGTRAGTTFTYTITVTNNGPDLLEGMISLTDNKTIVRRLKLKRVKPDQVPPAPGPSMYPSQ